MEKHFFDDKYVKMTDLIRILTIYPVQNSDLLYNSKEVFFIGFCSNYIIIIF